MKNIFSIILLSFFVFIFTGTKITDAESLLKGFGGTIISNPSTEIQALRPEYNCVVPGTTITIKPVGAYPTSYFIPSGTRSKTNTIPRSGQWILGLYSPTRTVITCTLKVTPFTPQIVTFPTITLYGTSKT